jgi:Na+-translocating ferredoxin:NAD+ oxidoreductase RnfG subunit
LSSRLAPALGLTLLLAGAALPVRGAVYHSAEEALQLAFPGADRIERRSLVLNDQQAAAVERAAESALDTRIWTLHVGYANGAVLGYAVGDVHTVRTLPVALMVVMGPEGKVRSLRMLAFHEPGEYQPGGRWLRQFDGRGLEPELRLERGVHTIAGATLSSRAVLRSVRRALALHQVLVRGESALAAE